ncbi:restriction endonuclease [bacterium]|nr:MAG: restriction endonuclease [bacterium]
MAEKETVVWGIHAGRTGDAHSLFMKNNVVAIGWTEMGDLSKIPPSRETFKEVVIKSYPNVKPGAIPNYTGQTFRFVCELQPGHYVVYPSKHDRQIHIGRVEGPFRYDPKMDKAYPNMWPVKWLKSLPRTQFSQGALYETGSAMSFFQVRNYAEEFLAAVEGKAAPLPIAKDETIRVIAEDIEATTQDFVLKTLAQELKGHPFAHFVAHLLEVMGYHTRVSPEGPDGGVDVIAHKDELGFEPPIVKVQVKSTEGNVGDPEVSALYGKVGSGEFGLFVTLGSFTSKAENFAKSKTNLRLIDGEELVALTLEHYDSFDSRYKGLLPLKRVFVPVPLEEPAQS